MGLTLAVLLAVIQHHCRAFVMYEQRFCQERGIRHRNQRLRQNLPQGWVSRGKHINIRDRAGPVPLLRSLGSYTMTADQL